MDPNMKDLTDEQLEAQLAGLGAEEAPETAAEEPAQQEQAATPQADPQAEPTTEAPAPAVETVATPEPEQPQQQQRTVPVSEHIAMRKRAQEAEERARRLEEEQAQKEAQAAEQQEIAQYRETYQRLVDEGRTEEAADYARRVNEYLASKARTEAEQKVTETRTQAEAEKAQFRLQASAEMAREVYGPERFDKAIQRLYAEFGAEWVDQMAAQQPNPAKWALEFAETKLAPTPEMIEQLVAKQVQEVLKKNAPPANTGHATIGHVSSQAQDPAPVKKAPRDLSDAELEEQLREATRKR